MITPGKFNLSIWKLQSRRVGGPKMGIPILASEELEFIYKDTRIIVEQPTSDAARE